MPAAVQHVHRFAWSPRPHPPPELDGWPFTVPAVAQLVADGGLDVPAGVTFLVGENGSGKSTLVEAMAATYPRWGERSTYLDPTGPTSSAEDSPLRWHLRALVHPQASSAGFFLRAELMHGYLSSIDANPNARFVFGEGLQARSHGESYLQVLRRRFDGVGVYFLDEPESALSFRSCLGLLSLLDVLRAEGSQVVVATHSPLLTALPGATLLELGEWGIRPTRYDDLELVVLWRDFLDSPDRFLHHLLDPS